MPTVIDVAELESKIGAHLGYSSWTTITQERINLFAEATGDHQWIHVDPERAKDGPFGGPIAHGYLTLSLIPALLGEVFIVQGVTMGVNYGANKVRFPSPVPVGAELRMGMTLAGVEEVAGGYQVTLDALIEIKDAPKPSCVAQVVYRFYL
ncbi:MAG: MaoC family dehydratase [Acidimicrobiales bacterium]